MIKELFKVALYFVIGEALREIAEMLMEEGLE